MDNPYVPSFYIKRIKLCKLCSVKQVYVTLSQTRGLRAEFPPLNGLTEIGIIHDQLLVTWARWTSAFTLLSTSALHQNRRLDLWLYFHFHGASSF